jgi:magnesium transporter
MSHPLFGPEVRLMLLEGDVAEMRTFCETLHPATVAEALTDDFSAEEVWRVLQSTSIRDQADIFEYFPIELQVELAEGTGRPHMARLIEQMSHDDRVRLLRRLPPRVAESILRLVDEADRRDIASLAKYPEGTVGALMTTDYAWLPATLRAGEAVERLRQQAPNSETIYYIYVLDEATRKLLGVVSLRDLILAPRNALVRDLMEEEVQTLRATDDRERAAQELARYDFLAMPVVDDEGRLVGIVTHDDVIDVVVQEATEDVHMMGAVAPLAENYLEAPFVTIWRKRASWLALLFGAELFTFTALSHFEDEIAKLVVLSLFVPLCISTGGNSGSQAATLITRALALGQLTAGNWGRVLRHELLMGLVLGVTLGVIAFARGWLTPESVRGGGKVFEVPFTLRVPKDRPPAVEGNVVEMPAGVAQLVTTFERPVRVELPAGEQFQVADDGSYREYRFPAKSELREPPVDRWSLAQVIALAVMGICLWGTIVGSMLPLAFKRIGVDPGIASSPFVATFVDVTGIMIYFSIAKVFLLSTVG